MNFMKSTAGKLKLYQKVRLVGFQSMPLASQPCVQASVASFLL